MQHIAPAELAEWLDDPARSAPLLLDVREEWEYDICHIEGARLVPMHELVARLGELGVCAVMLESGGRLLTHALGEGLVDEMILYLAPLLGGEANFGLGRGC